MWSIHTHCIYVYAVIHLVPGNANRLYQPINQVLVKHKEIDNLTFLRAIYVLRTTDKWIREIRCVIGILFSLRFVII